MHVIKKILKNSDNYKLTKIKGIVLETPDMNNNINATNIESYYLWNNSKNAGVHYVIDEHNIIQYVNDEVYCSHCKNTSKPNYINNILFNNMPNEQTLGVVVCYTQNQNYKKIEEKAIKFIAELLDRYSLDTNDLWREYDLNYSISPIQYLNENKWKSFLLAINDYLTNSKKEDFNQDLYTIKHVYKDTKSVQKEIANINKNSSRILPILKPYNKNLSILKQTTNKNQSDIKNIETEFNNTINYKTSEQSPINSEDSCIVPSAEGDFKVSPKNCFVEPIYPDTIVAPGNSSSVSNSKDNTETQQEYSISSIAEYEKRQKIFNPKKHAKSIKQSRGKPVNNNDPYPVDIKIQELEKHDPKIKIDNILFNFSNCNHPGCELGNKLIQDLCMLSEATVEQSKRTEQRIVRMENILSTILRYQFRLSSRININCVYYGGQDTFGKYKCIRCLHEDLINDGQSMTIDQCLNCSRYEPIIGQIYDIIDNDGINLAAILDDNQMAYSDMNEYIDLNRIEKMHNQKNNADFKKTININNTIKTKEKQIEKINKDTYQKEKKRIQDKTIKENKKNKDKGDIANKAKIKPKDQKIIIDKFAEQRKIDKSIPKQFENIWPKGFVMDWTTKELEQQVPNINKYNLERLEKFVEEYYNPKKKKFEDGFIDTRKETKLFNNLEYDSEKYQIEGFESSFSGDNNYFGLGGSIVRDKIIEEAERICKACANDKARYSMALRYRHGNNKLNGIEYFDCSSFAQYCYKKAGLVLNGATTWPQKDECQSSAGGQLFPISEITKKGKKGDLLFTANVGHVGIYDGNGGHIAAHGCLGKYAANPRLQITHNNSLSTFAYVGRPRALVEADKKANTQFQDVHIPSNVSNKEFLKILSPMAVVLMHKYKIWASFIIASACIESSWGTSPVARESNNLYGVKAYSDWKGKRSKNLASEGDAYYRAYDSIFDSMEDHCKVLMHSRYKKLRECGSPIKAGYLLQPLGYCGDTNRGATSESIIKHNDLLKLDKM